jgi:hypothetical protein
MLKSWNRLKQEGFHNEKFPIGKKLGDPEELRDYILFGTGTTGEIVVNSKQNRALKEWCDFIRGILDMRHLFY